MKLFFTVLAFCLIGSIYGAALPAGATAATKDTCNGVTSGAAATLKTNCDIVEATGKTQKCCLIVWSAVPKYNSLAITAKSSVSGHVGGQADDLKSVCYKKGGVFEFATTAATNNG